MFNFEDWLNKSDQRKSEKKNESEIIKNQMNEYFQPERLSEKTIKDNDGSDSLNSMET